MLSFPFFIFYIQSDLRFTFQEFVRFIVNGTIDFANDKYVLNHKGLSYHWAPYWKECNVCSPTTMPQFIIHLDSLKEDLALLLNRIQGIKNSDDESISILNEFPHTHSSEEDINSKKLSGKNHKLKKYFSTLTKSDIQELYDKYKLDHVLFGYSTEDFFKYLHV